MGNGDDFERRLNRLFDEAPVFPDASLFAAEVQHRLDRGQALRRAVISVMGGVGAVVAAGQLMSSGWLTRLTDGLQLQERAGDARWTALLGDAEAMLSPGMLRGEVLWTVAALAGLAVAFVATRVADQL